MPDRMFTPRHHPPSSSDRPRAHLEASGMAIGGMAVGLLLLVSALLPSYDPAPSLAELPEWISAVTGASMAIGSALRLWSIGHRYPTRDEYWRDHRWGCLGQATGWGVYAAAAAILRPHAQVPYLLGATFALLALWALVESILDEARIRGDRPCSRTREVPPSESV